MKNKDIQPSGVTLAHVIVLDMCRTWAKVEEKLNVIDFDQAHGDPIWMNVLSVNIFDPINIDTVFGLDNIDTKVLTRLSQLYLNVIVTMGRPYVVNLHSDINITMSEFGLKHYKAYIKHMPFIVLIPFLNEIYIERILDR